MTPIADPIVHRRPHFRRSGEHLHFMASQRPCRNLSELEQRVWDAIDFPTSLASLCASLGSATSSAVATLCAAGQADLVETDFAHGRKRVLVIEPHADDAALSVGATLWRRRHECEFTIATMASRSNFTSYYYLDRDYFSIDSVVAMRNAESALFARLIGGRHLPVGLTDAALRYCDQDWTLEFYRRHRGAVAAAIGRDADPAEMRRWVAAARHLLAMPGFDEIWIPQGSPHGDHRLTAEACLSALVADRRLAGRVALRLYQDVPYAARYPRYSEEMAAALRASGFVLEDAVLPVGDALEAKLRLVSVYASQFKIDALRSDIESSAALAGAGKPAERMWTLRELPAPPADWHRRCEPPTVARAVRRTSDWLGRNRRRPKVRILLLVPSGRWKVDLELLLAMLPTAAIEVFAAPAALAEVEAAGLGGGRVRIREVEAGSRAWSTLAVRLAFAPPEPTLFLVGERREREATWLSRLWPRSDTLVVTSLDALVRAADEALDADRMAA